MFVSEQWYYLQLQKLPQSIIFSVSQPIKSPSDVCVFKDVLLENVKSLHINARLVSSVSTASQLQPLGLYTVDCCFVVLICRA